MERLGVVTALGGQSWRVLAGPVAFLLAVTVAVGLVRSELRSHPSGGTTHRKAASTKAESAPAHKAVHHRVYVVRAGDTVYGIATKTGIPTGKLLQLNPKISPTALFIGEKIRLG